MKHPNPNIQKNQDDFLKTCPETEREFHEQLFRVGNASYIYHGLAQIDEKSIKQYFTEWLEGLPSNIRNVMEKKGFEECKTMLPFTRYVNERNDIGMDKWMKDNLSDKDYIYYKSNENINTKKL